MLTLAEIKTEVDRLAGVIGAPASLLPTYGVSRDGAYPHIEVDARQYHYVIVERGQELERFSTRDLDELLERTFRDVTSTQSFSHERAHRDPARDSRRMAFAHQVELLAKLSPTWAAREERRHQDILRTHPFNDEAGLRATLAGQYMAQGMAPEAAAELADQQYPKRREA